MQNSLMQSSIEGWGAFCPHGCRKIGQNASQPPIDDAFIRIKFFPFKTQNKSAKLLSGLPSKRVAGGFVLGCIPQNNNRRTGARLDGRPDKSFASFHRVTCNCAITRSFSKLAFSCFTFKPFALNAASN